MHWRLKKQIQKFQPENLKQRHPLGSLDGYGKNGF
jgi:hypothetical protein